MEKFMHDYLWKIPEDEMEEYDKMAFRLLNREIPLYFLPTTELVDSINISNIFVQNALIGTTQVIYEEDSISHLMKISDQTDMGNIAIELIDTLLDNDLLYQQLYVVPTLYATNLNAVLQIKLGILGELQEDYFSAYFTGRSIRQYAYRREDYWKRNYIVNEYEEVEGDNTTKEKSKEERQSTKTPLLDFIKNLLHS